MAYGDEEEKDEIDQMYLDMEAQIGDEEDGISERQIQPKANLYHSMKNVKTEKSTKKDSIQDILDQAAMLN